ncbi:ABC transporter substrate-binding protein [Chloroflexota bacterium]
MTKKIIWLMVSCLMALSLVMASCGPAAVEKDDEEKDVVTEKEEEEKEEAEKEEVSKKEMVTTTLKKVDGTSVTVTREKPKYGGTHTQMLASFGLEVFDPAHGIWVAGTTLFQTQSSLITGDWARGPLGTNETNWWIGVLFHITLEKGELAESWEMPDDETIVFHLRPGVHWALNPASEASKLVGGRELTAEDVAWSINREWGSNRSFIVNTTPAEGKLISAEATDKYTVELKVPPAYQGFHMFLSGDDLFIMPREVIEKYGDMNDWKNSVGSGAWMLTDYIRGSSLSYEKNQNYFEESPLYPGDKLPYADKLKQLIIGDRSTQQAALRTGKIDVLENVTWEDQGILTKANSELQYIKKTGHATLALAPRLDKEELPFTNVEVRRAMNMALNKERMVDEYYKGNAAMYAYPFNDDAAHQTVFTPLNELSERAQELFEYNPEEAKRLLAEAGYPDGFKTKVVCSNLADNADVMSIVKEDLLMVGIDMEINAVENSIYSSISRARSHEELILASSMENFTSVKLMSFRSEGTDDRSYFEAAETRAAYNEIKQYIGKDDAKCDQILKEITPFILENPWGVYLPFPNVYDIWWPWLHDYEGQWNFGDWNPRSYSRYIWIDQDLKREMGY